MQNTCYYHRAFEFVCVREIAACSQQVEAARAHAHGSLVLKHFHVAAYMFPFHSWCHRKASECELWFWFRSLEPHKYQTPQIFQECGHAFVVKTQLGHSSCTIFLTAVHVFCPPSVGSQSNYTNSAHGACERWNSFNCWACNPEGSFSSATFAPLLWQERPAPSRCDHAVTEIGPKVLV